MEIDISKFSKIAECNDGIYKNYMAYHRPHEKFYGVYLIHFNSELNYIGYSNHLHKRIRQHYSGMVVGNNDLPQLNKAYKETKRFSVYLLHDKKGEGIGEDEFIYAFKPSLNKMIPYPNRIHINAIQEIAGIIGITASELIADDEAKTSITCPYCDTTHDRDLLAANNILRRGIVELESDSKTPKHSADGQLRYNSTITRLTA